VASGSELHACAESLPDDGNHARRDGCLRTHWPEDRGVRRRRLDFQGRAPVQLLQLLRHARRGPPTGDHAPVRKPGRAANGPFAARPGSPPASESLNSLSCMSTRTAQAALRRGLNLEKRSRPQALSALTSPPSHRRPIPLPHDRHQNGLDGTPARPASNLATCHTHARLESRRQTRRRTRARRPLIGDDRCTRERQRHRQARTGHCLGRRINRDRAENP
jgi:hypothetical protein